MFLLDMRDKLQLEVFGFCVVQRSPRWSLAFDFPGSRYYNAVFSACGPGAVNQELSDASDCITLSRRNVDEDEEIEEFMEDDGDTGEEESVEDEQDE